MNIVETFLVDSLTEPNQRISVFYDTVPKHIVSVWVMNAVIKTESNIRNALGSDEFMFFLEMKHDNIKMTDLNSNIKLERFDHRSLKGLVSDTVVGIGLDDRAIFEIQERFSAIEDVTVKFFDLKDIC